MSETLRWEITKSEYRGRLWPIVTLAALFTSGLLIWQLGLRALGSRDFSGVILSLSGAFLGSAIFLLVRAYRYPVTYELTDEGMWVTRSQKKRLYPWRDFLFMLTHEEVIASANLSKSAIFLYNPVKNFPALASEAQKITGSTYYLIRPSILQARYLSHTHWVTVQSEPENATAVAQFLTTKLPRATTEQMRLYSRCARITGWVLAIILIGGGVFLVEYLS